MRKGLARRLSGVVIGNDGRVTTNNGQNPEGSHEPAFLPTPLRIWLMTRLIKSTWDEEQRNSRKVLRYDLFQCGGSK